MVSYKSSSHRTNFKDSLNPCCNGQWSRTRYGRFQRQSKSAVLILVVMDNGLVRERHLGFQSTSESLNPCCNGQWSRTRPYKTILIISKLKNFTKQILTFLNRKLTIP